MIYNRFDLVDDLKTIGKNVFAIFITLIYWEILLYINLHNSLSGFSMWNILFMLPISICISFFTGWHKKINSITLILVLFLISIFYEANLIYYKTFGSLFSISMVGVGGDAITNFWWSVEVTIKENLLMVILFELPIILLIIESIWFKKLKSNYTLWVHPILLILSVGIWFLIVLALPLGGTKDYTAYGAYHSRFVDTDTASKKLGILPNTLIETRYALIGSGRENLIEIKEEIVVEEIKEEIEFNKYDGLNFKNLEELSNTSSLSNILDYLNTVRPTQKNDYTGMFEGYNLIYICAESFSRMAIDKNITPTLYKLANNGFVLENYYNAFKNVTTNGEYAMLTGLWPDVAREETNMGKLSGTMGQSIDNNMQEALGNKFNELGIQSYGYHNYIGSYYGRNKTLPNMGFTCKFMNDGMTFTTNWPASDLEMIEQSLPDYINDEQFCAYYMTFSGHGNYSVETNVIAVKNVEEVKQKLGDKYLPESAIGYYACNLELDKALEYLMNELEKAGKLDNTVIVMTGDHYPYYLTDYAYEALNGKKISNDFEDYRSTCIIFNSKMSTEHIKTACCNVDILPTVLNLFGIDYDSRLYAGNDILSDGKHVAMLYNKSFITDTVKYDATTGKTIWLKDVHDKTDEELDAYIEEYSSYVKNKYAYSIAVENNDLYRFIFDNYTKPEKETITEYLDVNQLEEEKNARR